MFFCCCPLEHFNIHAEPHYNTTTTELHFQELQTFTVVILDSFILNRLLVKILQIQNKALSKHDTKQYAAMR